MAKNPIATLKAIKAMGCQDFETYEYDAQKNMFYRFTASEFNIILEDLDLTITSGHYGFAPFIKQSDEALKKYVDRCIIGAKAVKSKYIT